MFHYYRKYHNVSISWSGVWLLILLLFTDVVNTSVSILNCPILRDSDGHRSKVKPCGICVFLFYILFISHIEMVCRWYSGVLLRRSCWSSNICHISTDSVYTTNNSSGGGCFGKSEGEQCEWATKIAQKYVHCFIL